jgi:hypothetical protein
MVGVRPPGRHGARARVDRGEDEAWAAADALEHAAEVDGPAVDRDRADGRAAGIGFLTGHARIPGRHTAGGRVERGDERAALPADRLEEAARIDRPAVPGKRADARARRRAPAAVVLTVRPDVSEVRAGRPADGREVAADEPAAAAVVHGREDGPADQRARRPRDTCGRDRDEAAGRRPEAVEVARDDQRVACDGEPVDAGVRHPRQRPRRAGAGRRSERQRRRRRDAEPCDRPSQGHGPTVRAAANAGLIRQPASFRARLGATRGGSSGCLG